MYFSVSVSFLRFNRKFLATPGAAARPSTGTQGSKRGHSPPTYRETHNDIALQIRQTKACFCHRSGKSRCPAIAAERRRAFG